MKRESGCIRQRHQCVQRGEAASGISVYKGDSLTGRVCCRTEGHSAATKEALGKLRETILSDCPNSPLPISLSALTARLPLPMSISSNGGASRESEGAVCVLARCALVSAPGPGPAEVVAAAPLVCFGCDIFSSLFVCCFCSLISHCLPVGLPSVAETA